MSAVESGPNLVQVRRWTEAEDWHREDEWPAPPEYAEFIVIGRMRQDVLRRIGAPADDARTISMVTGVIEGGYSEYTVEHDYEIEVWIQEGGQKQRLFNGDSYSEKSAVAQFLRWLDVSERAVPDRLFGVEQ